MTLSKQLHTASLFVTPLVNLLGLSSIERAKRWGKVGPKIGARLRGTAIKWLDKVDDAAIALAFIRLHAATDAIAADEDYSVKVKDIDIEKLQAAAEKLAPAYMEAFARLDAQMTAEETVELAMETARLVSTIAELHGTCSALNAKMERQQVEISSLEGMAVSLQTDAAESREIIAGLERQILNRDDLIGNLRAVNEDLLAQILDKDDRIYSLRAVNEDLLAQILDKDITIENLQEVEPIAAASDGATTEDSPDSDSGEEGNPVATADDVLDSF